MSTVKQTFSPDQSIERANPSTIQNCFLVGYQGWFTCAGDGPTIVGPGVSEWSHWFKGSRPTTDLWPDVSEYSASELFPVPGLKHKSGDRASLFSSRNGRTVQRHFHWMALHGVDGVFLQRFLGQCDPNYPALQLRDEIGRLVKNAAETEGRVWAINYDVSGLAPARILQLIQDDWTHLIRDENVLDSPGYLRERGQAVICLSGCGFSRSGHSPDLLKSIASCVRDITPGGVYLIACTPSCWRTGKGDADPDPEFLRVWLNSFDAIMPWTMGRFRDPNQLDEYFQNLMIKDIQLLNQRNNGRSKHVDYIAVVLPGASLHNTSLGNLMKRPFNEIGRRGGQLLWKQIFNAHRQGVRIMFGSSWDEYDEGTALMPVVQSKEKLPISPSYRFLASDEDGYELPSDWYMRICGLAVDSLRGRYNPQEAFPFESLRHYWTRHPYYEVSLFNTVPLKGQPMAVGNRQDLSPPPYSPDRESSTSATNPKMGQQAGSPPLSARPLPFPPTHTPVLSNISGELADSTRGRGSLQSQTQASVRDDSPLDPRRDDPSIASEQTSVLVYSRDDEHQQDSVVSDNVSLFVAQSGLHLVSRTVSTFAPFPASSSRDIPTISSPFEENPYLDTGNGSITASPSLPLLSPLESPLLIGVDLYRHPAESLGTTCRDDFESAEPSLSPASQLSYISDATVLNREASSSTALSESQTLAEKERKGLSRFLTKKGKQKVPKDLDGFPSADDLKIMKEEQKKYRKQEAKSRTERLAYELAWKAKQAKLARENGGADPPSGEPSIFGGFIAGGLTL